MDRARSVPGTVLKTLVNVPDCMVGRLEAPAFDDTCVLGSDTWEGGGRVLRQRTQPAT